MSKELLTEASISKLSEERNIGRYSAASILAVKAFKHNPEAIKTGVAKVLHDGADSSLRERIQTSHGVAKHVRRFYPAPPWLRRNGVIRIAGELSSASMWGNALAALPKTDEEEAALQNLSLDTLAKKISHNNSDFFTAGVAMGLVAAAIGPEAEECLKDDPKPAFRRDFMSVVGRRYPDEAESPDVFLSRVQELMPDPATKRTQKGQTLLGRMFAYYAFEGNPLSSGKSARCPATPQTIAIFEQWGQQLASDPLYRERFQRTVTK